MARKVCPGVQCQRIENVVSEGKAGGRDRPSGSAAPLFVRSRRSPWRWRRSSRTPSGGPSLPTTPWTSGGPCPTPPSPPWPRGPRRALPELQNGRWVLAWQGAFLTNLFPRVSGSRQMHDKPIHEFLMRPSQASRPPPSPPPTPPLNTVRARGSPPPTPAAHGDAIVTLRQPGEVATDLWDTESGGWWREGGLWCVAARNTSDGDNLPEAMVCAIFGRPRIISNRHCIAFLRFPAAFAILGKQPTL